MNIIIKFIIKNIKEKKMRTFLIVFSIMISSALLFASTAITDSLTKMYVDQIKKSYGESQILVKAGKTSPSKYFTPAVPEEYKARMEYMIGVFNGVGVYKYKKDGMKDENVTLNIRGIDWNDQQKLSPVVLSDKFDLDSFKGKKIVISKKTADKYALGIGKILEVNIEGTKYKFLISGIAQMTGPFSDDGQTHFAMIPKDTLSSIYDQKGSVSTLYIKLSNPEEKDKIVKGLSSVFKRYTVKDTISKADLAEQTGGITVALSMALVLVVFMSVFIIYSSFKVITTERIPVIGTFRSVGASRKVTDLVLLLESIIYGVTGGLLGNGLGIGILYLIAQATKPVWDPSYKTSIAFSLNELVMSFMMAVILSLVSSIVPIIKTSKIPVKDIVLNKLDSSKKGNKLWKPVLGCIFLLLVFIVPPYTEGNSGILINTICILLAVASVILLIPYATWLFITVFERIFSCVFGNEGVLAVKNLRNNKSLLNNISLLAIGISSLLMINTVSRSSVTEIINYFDTCMKYEVSFGMPNMNRDMLPSIRSTEGVRDAKGIYSGGGIEVKGTDKTIDIEGMNNDWYMDYVNIELGASKAATQAKLTELDASRNIIITLMLKNKLGVKAGDTLTLRMPAGDRDYKVIDVWDSMMYGGNYSIVSEKYLKADMQLKYYNDIEVKTNGSPDDVLKALKDKFSRNEPGGITIKEIKDIIVKSNSQLFSVMNGFSFLTVLIGIFGVFNNLIISFIERKRSLAVLRSVGMNKTQIIKMIFVESLSGGLIGGIVGVVTGLLMIIVMGYTLKIVIATIPMHYSVSLLLSSGLAGVVIMLAASISPAMKSSKLNIIEAIKYE